MTSSPLLMVRDLREKYDSRRKLQGGKSKEEEGNKLKFATTENNLYYKMAIDFIAGCLGGGAGVLVSHPFDTIKVHMQTQTGDKKYRGTWHCFREILATEKVPGLFKGMSSPLAGVSFVNAIVFGVYGNTQRMLTDPDTIKSHAIAGGVAGIFQSVVCAPMELAKTRIQLQQNQDSARKFKSPLNYIIYIQKTNGIRGSMKGLTITAVRDLPGFASYFSTYEFLMQSVANPNIAYTLWAGGMAGVSSWLACYPIDVVKTCIQGDDTNNPKYKGYIDCVRQGYKSDGVHFFFRGFMPTLLRSFPMNAACFLVVSTVMNIANKDGINIVVQNGDPKIHLNMSMNTPPLCHCLKTHVELPRLQTFGVFSDAVCHTEATDLAYKRHGNASDNDNDDDDDKYYVYNNERIIQQIEEILSKEQSIDC